MLKKIYKEQRKAEDEVVNIQLSLRHSRSMKDCIQTLRYCCNGSIIQRYADFITVVSFPLSSSAYKRVLPPPPQFLSLWGEPKFQATHSLTSLIPRLLKAFKAGRSPGTRLVLGLIRCCLLLLQCRILIGFTLMLISRAVGGPIIMYDKRINLTVSHFYPRNF